MFRVMTEFNVRFSDFMQKGASLPAPQLMKVITRGRTSRLSAEPLLEFFRPLEAWLEQQNRDETVSLVLATKELSLHVIFFRSSDGRQTWTMFSSSRTWLSTAHHELHCITNLCT